MRDEAPIEPLTLWPSAGVSPSWIEEGVVAAGSGREAGDRVAHRDRRAARADVGRRRLLVVGGARAVLPPVRGVGAVGIDAALKLRLARGHALRVGAARARTADARRAGGDRARDAPRAGRPVVARAGVADIGE